MNMNENMNLSSNDIFECNQKQISQTAQNWQNGNVNAYFTNPTLHTSQCNLQNYGECNEELKNELHSAEISQFNSLTIGDQFDSSSYWKNLIGAASPDALFNGQNLTCASDKGELVQPYLTSFCWCEMSNIQAALNSCSFGKNWLTANEVERKIGGEAYYSNLNYDPNMKLSKNDINLELLKEFEYDTEVRDVEGEEEPQTIYICKFNDCNKEFTRTWNILDHARMHKGIKPYKCDFCLKEFTQKGNLRKHMKTHLIPNIDQRKRYKCEHCDSSYTERYNYKAHLKKHHVDKIRRVSAKQGYNEV